MSEIARAYQPEDDLPTPEIINGFDLDMEIEAIKRRGLGDTKANMLGWGSEYLLGLKVFKNPIKIDENGHLVNSISGIRLVDVTNPTEREGKPLQAVISAEEALANAEIGGVLVIDSPSGDSQDHRGRQIHLKHAQVYAFEKKVDGIDAVTIVIDNSLEDGRQLLRNSGKTEAEVSQGKTQYEQECHVAGIAAYFPPERGLSLEGVVGEINQARTENNHPLAESVRDSLQKQVEDRENNSAELDRANRIIALYFGQFEQFFTNGNQDLDNKFTQLRVRVELYSTLEKIARQVKFGRAEIEEIINRRLSQFERTRTYQFLGSLTGCNDSFGGGMTWVDGPFGRRIGYYGEKPQKTEFINGEYFLIFDSGERIKGKKCSNSLCGVTVCGDRCFRCKKFLI